MRPLEVVADGCVVEHNDVGHNPARSGVADRVVPTRSSMVAPRSGCFIIIFISTGSEGLHTGEGTARSHSAMRGTIHSVVQHCAIELRLC